MQSAALEKYAARGTPDGKQRHLLLSARLLSFCFTDTRRRSVKLNGERKKRRPIKRPSVRQPITAANFGDSGAITSCRRHPTGRCLAT